MTITEIFAIEPRLIDLEADAKSFRDVKPVSAREEQFYRHVKPKMVLLVGWTAQMEELSSPATYNTVYNHFLDVLGI